MSEPITPQQFLDALRQANHRGDVIPDSRVILLASTYLETGTEVAVTPEAVAALSCAVADRACTTERAEALLYQLQSEGLMGS